MVAYITNAIRMSAVFLFGSTGEIITEKSGHLNLGIPGIMCMGAVGGSFGQWLYISWLNGAPINGFLTVLIPVLFALLFAGSFGVIYSFLTVTLRANQNITGLALTTFGVGVAGFINSFIDKAGFSQASKYYITLFPFADKLGWFGSIFLSHGFLVYFAIIIALLSAYMLNKTRFGLHLRAVGESPQTADATGISVTKYRYVATIIGSMIAGLGGLFYFMDMNGGNWPYCGPIESLGWMSIAIVIFTTWKPNLSIIGSIVFGALYQFSGAFSISMSIKEVVSMLPYVVTIIVLVITSILNKKESQPPASLGLNYFREER